MNGLRLTRRALIGGVASVLALAGFGLRARLFNSPSEIPCLIRGANFRRAHRLRNGEEAKPSTILQSDVVIVGSGVAGLSAARQLKKAGVDDFCVLELEDDIGGNAQSGSTEFGAHPFGAHYLPIVSNECAFLHEFLEEAGVIVGYEPSGDPVYNDEYLCHDLEERLFINGRFCEGLIPEHGLSPSDKREVQRFLQLMQSYKERRGSDGKMAFTIPLSLSSQDEDLLSLDKISMRAFLNRNDFHSPYLHWYVNYCCRDDYGAGIDVVSAWAGLHYFASRRTSSSLEPANLTWPEGNSFLIKKLAATFTAKIHTGVLVTRVEEDGEGVLVSAYDANKDQYFAIRAKAVVCAVPYFVAKRICKGAELPELSPSYFPWLVANLSVTGVADAPGEQLAWDNVNYYSRSLGYIDAAHQKLEAESLGRNVTYYRPLDDEAFGPLHRRKLLEKDASFWRSMILDDLRVVHPGLQAHIKAIDVWLWGHGMVCPTVGYLWHSARKNLPQSSGGVYFAHSDLSGISIFEEAYFQGLTAAKALLKHKSL